MNIFATNACPRKTANEHGRTHRNKMILEHCQLLSTAHRELDGVPTEVYEFSVSQMRYIKRNIKLVQWDEVAVVEGLDAPMLRSTGIYKQSHTNHPSAVWVRESVTNYMWLVECTRELIELFNEHHGKTHGCERVFKILSSNLPSNLPDGKLTPFKPAMPDEYKEYSSDVHVCYQAYVNDKLNQWQRDNDAGHRIKDPSFDVPLPTWRNKETDYVQISS